MREIGELSERKTIALHFRCDCWDKEQELCMSGRPCVCLRRAREKITRMACGSSKAVSKILGRGPLGLIRVPSKKGG